MKEKVSDYYLTHDEWGRPTTTEEYNKTNCHVYCDWAQHCFKKGENGRNPESCIEVEYIEHLRN